MLITDFLHFSSFLNISMHIQCTFKWKVIMNSEINLYLSAYVFLNVKFYIKIFVPIIFQMLYLFYRQKFKKEHIHFFNFKGTPSYIIIVAVIGSMFLFLFGAVLILYFTYKRRTGNYRLKNKREKWYTSVSHW